MKFNGKVGALLVCSLFLSTTVPQNLHARTVRNYRAEFVNSQKLADAFNKFRYDMTVEWNQEDPYFKEHAQKELFETLKQLQANGVSANEILAFMQNNILDQKARKDYDRLLDALLSQGLHEDAASRVAMDHMEKNYKQGVGFNGIASTSKTMVVLGIVIVGVVTYLIIQSNRDSGSSTTTDTTSTDTSTTGDHCHQKGIMHGC